MFVKITGEQDLESVRCLAPIPFVDEDWLSCWLKHLPYKPIIEISKSEQGNVIVPYVRKGSGANVYEISGCDLFDYTDIAADSAYEDTVADFFKNCEADAIVFKRLREDSRCWPIVSQNRLAGFLAIRKASVSAPFVEVSGSWPEYLGTLRKKFIADVHRQIKRLGLLGTFSFEIVSEQAQVDHISGVLFDQHARRRKLIGQNISIFENESCREFFLDLNKRLLNKGRLFLCYLKVDEKIIAVCESFIYEGRLYYYLPAFDENYKPYSPGNVLLYHILQYAFEHKFTEVDLMAGEEGYKLNWNARARQTSNVLIYRDTFKGRLAKSQLSWGDFLSDVKQSLAKSPLKKFKQSLFKMYYRHEK